MFPKENEEVEIRKDNKANDIEKHSYIFDFNTGEFSIKDGKLQRVEGMDALKIWIQKNIHTDIKKEKIYTKFGVDIMNLINRSLPQSFLEEEIKRQIKDALILNNKIINVNNFVFDRNKRKLNCEFTCDTIYGNITSEIYL